MLNITSGFLKELILDIPRCNLGEFKIWALNFCHGDCLDVLRDIELMDVLFLVAADLCSQLQTVRNCDLENLKA